jgi:Putative peptidoglycan binding domain
MRVIPIATFFMALFSFAAADAATHRHPKHGSSSQVAALTSESINGAAPQGASSDPAIIVKTEVLLDRDGFAPGEIDGKNGDNFRKALAAFQQANNLKPSGKLDADTWNALLKATWLAHLTNAFPAIWRKSPSCKACPTKVRKKSSPRNFT